MRFIPLSLVLLILISSCKGQVGGKSTAEGAETLTTQKNVNPENGNGFSLYDKTTVFPQIHSHLHGMVSEFIFKIHEEDQGNFWFATNHDGIIHYNGKRLSNYTKQDGLGGTAVRDIVQDSLGNIWFGTSGGLTKYNGKSFTNFSVDAGLLNEEIWALEIDKNRTIWVATNGGASKFDGNKFETFVVPKAKVADPKPMISGERIADILIDSKGIIWFVTDGYGISKFNGKDFEFLTNQNGLTDNNVASVFEDSRGNIWIGTFYGGVSKYDGKSFTNFTKEGIIEGQEAYNFCEDKNGNIWFSVEGFGVYRYDGKVFTQFTTADGLTTNGVQHIYADKKGQVWFCTWAGISLFDGEKISDVAEKEPWTR